MARLVRCAIVSVVFWLLLNLIALRHISSSNDHTNSGGSSLGVGKLVDTALRRNGIGARRPHEGSSGKTAHKGDGNEDEEQPEIEPEDSASSSSGGDVAVTPMPLPSGHEHRHHALLKSKHTPPTDAPPSSLLHVNVKPKHAKGKDPLPRSVGNSLKAAPTTPVTIRSDTIRFAIVGDWGGPGREPQKNVAHAMDAVASSDPQHHIHFVVSTGDNMYEDGVSGVKDHKFKRNFEDVYTQPNLQCRWYMSLGNHDHGAHGVMRDAQAEVNYTSLSKRWFLPSTYYTQLFHVQGSHVPHHETVAYTVLLIVLDTYDYSPRVTQMTEQQLHWFEEVLKASSADVKLVVGHRPLFSAGAKHGSSPYMQKKLEPLMVKYGVSAYMCGDDHELQVMRSKGVLHLLSGGGARAKHDLKPNGIQQTVFQAGVHGFMWVAVNQTNIVVEVYNQHVEHLYRGVFPTLDASP